MTAATAAQVEALATVIRHLRTDTPTPTQIARVVLAAGYLPPEDVAEVGDAIDGVLTQQQPTISIERAREILTPMVEPLIVDLLAAERLRGAALAIDDNQQRDDALARVEQLHADAAAGQAYISPDALRAALDGPETPAVTP